jgi:hypothetical protein
VTDLKESAPGENIPLALVGWISGCTMIWSSLFAVGNFLYGRLPLAFMLLTVFFISASILITVINKLSIIGKRAQTQSS